MLIAQNRLCTILKLRFTVIIKNLKILVFYSFLILFVAGCNHSKKPFLKRIEECTCQKQYSDSLFFSFDKTRFDKSEILTFFTKNVQIDSSIKKRSDGGEILDYTFRDDSSKVIFVLYDYADHKFDFNIAYFQIKTDIFRFNNDIKINMTRSDFFKTLNTKISDCDTFDIFADKPGYYFRCVFNKDKLKSVTIELIEL